MVLMRRTTLTIAILALVWIGYITWPIYDLFVLIRAVESRDIGTVTRRVYFDAVRISLTNHRLHAAHRSPDQSLCAELRFRWPRHRRSGCAEAYLAGSALPAPHCWLAGNNGAGWTTARYDRNNNEYDRNHLADFWKFGVWPRQIRSDGAGR